MEIKNYLEDLCIKAKAAQRELAISSFDNRNAVLASIAENLVKSSDEILSANAEDIKSAKESGISDAMCDRLTLTKARIESMANAMRKLMAIPDVLGKSEGFTRPNGLIITKTRVPIGNIAIIYEARPNVTVDAAALCIKSGNSVILRGGKEAYNTNLALEKAIKSSLAENGFSEDAVSLVHNTERESSTELMKLSGFVDVLIPRGSGRLIKAVVQNASVPVIETGAGNCHVFIDKYADIEMAKKIALSAKISRPSVCNAMEKLLVHKDIAAEFVPEIVALYKENGVEVRGDAAVCALAQGVIAAKESDFTEEYNDYIVTVYIKDSIDAAIEHINRYNTGHSEAIITKDIESAEKFQSRVDAAAVYVNASTRFTDGEEFGFGAEIGISTQKLHARGPCGLAELTTVKYRINGNGQIR